MENKMKKIFLVIVLASVALLLGFVSASGQTQNTSYSTFAGNNTTVSSATGNATNCTIKLQSPSSLYIIGQDNKPLSGYNPTITINSSCSDKGLYLSPTSGGGSYSYHNSSYSKNSFNLLSLPSNLSVGDYRLTVNSSGGGTDSITFSVGQAYMINTSKAQVGVPTYIKANINFPSSFKWTAIVYFGDGNNGVAAPTAETVHDNYNATGKYNLSAEIISTSTKNPFNSSWISMPLTVTASVKDTTPPHVTLISPTSGQVINSSTINFSYRAWDNVGIANCSFYLYNPDGNGIFGTPVVDNPSNNSAVTHTYSNFSDGEYSWDVVCYDPSGNHYDASGDTGVTSFKVSTTSNTYPYESQINQAKQAISNFTSGVDSMSQDEVNALIDLGIMSNLTGVHGFSEQLNNIFQFFQTNQSGYISNPVNRANVINGNVNELMYILSHIPTEVLVTASQTFIKNSITKNMAGIARTFEEYNGATLTDGQISSLAQKNDAIQKYILVSTDSRNVQIDYPNSTKEMTLVTKQINISNSNYTTVLESFPLNLSSQVTFLPSKTKGIEVTEINKTLYEIPSNYLSDNGGEIIYYLTPPVSQDTIKQTDTVLFENFPIQSLGMTGFSILGGDTAPSFSYMLIFVMALIVVVGGTRVKRKVDLSKWKKEDKVVKVIDEIDRARRALKNDNNTELAKESYHNIKEIFLLTPKGFRDHARKEIERIRKGIDRRDIIGFVKEYEKAKFQGREEDSKRLYREIKMTYKRLPKKDQERIYNKMFGGEWEI